MQTLKKLYLYNKRAFKSIIVYMFLALFIDAVATQYLPVIILSLSDNFQSLIIPLIAVNLLFCLINIMLSPRLKYNAKRNSAIFLEFFREKNVENYLRLSLDDNPNEYHNSLVIATEHAESFLNENISQIIYRLLYGIGSLVILGLLSPKLLVIVLVAGIIVCMVRRYFQPNIDMIANERLKNRKSLISSFKHVLSNRYYYVDKSVYKRSFDEFRQVDSAFTKQMIKHAQKRGTMLLVISFLCELILLITAVFLVQNTSANAGILLAIRPAINFFNFIGITIISTRENLNVLKKFFEGKWVTEENISKNMHTTSEQNNVGLIQIKNVSFSYDDTPLFEQFNYTFEGGHLYEIRGKRGTGKTTLIKLIYNIVSPKTGEIMLNGYLNKELSLSKHIFYYSTDATPFILSLEENVLLGKEKPDNYDDIIKRLGLATIKNSSCRNLSTGEQARLALARGLISDRRILLLDEFNANLDTESIYRIVEMLKERVNDGALVIIVNHKLIIEGSKVVLVGEDSCG